MVKVTSKTTGKTHAIRDLRILDDSGMSVELTLWDEEAEAFNLEDFRPPLTTREPRGPFILVKGAEVIHKIDYVLIIKRFIYETFIYYFIFIH